MVQLLHYSSVTFAALQFLLYTNEHVSENKNRAEICSIPYYITWLHVHGLIEHLLHPTTTIVFVVV